MVGKGLNFFKHPFILEGYPSLIWFRCFNCFNTNSYQKREYRAHRTIENSQHRHEIAFEMTQELESWEDRCKVSDEYSQIQVDGEDCIVVGESKEPKSNASKKESRSLKAEEVTIEKEKESEKKTNKIEGKGDDVKLTSKGQTEDGSEQSNRRKSKRGKSEDASSSKKERVSKKAKSVQDAIEVIDVSNKDTNSTATTNSTHTTTITTNTTAIKVKVKLDVQNETKLPSSEKVSGEAVQTTETTKASDQEIEQGKKRKRTTTKGANNNDLIMKEGEYVAVRGPAILWVAKVNTQVHIFLHFHIFYLQVREDCTIPFSQRHKDLIPVLWLIEAREYPGQFFVVDSVRWKDNIAFNTIVQRDLVVGLNENGLWEVAEDTEKLAQNM